MKDKVLKYILSLDHYPTWTEILVHFKLENAQETDKALCQLRDEGSIMQLEDDSIIVTAITNPKLQKLIDESVSITDINAKRGK